MQIYININMILRRHYNTGQNMYADINK